MKSFAPLILFLFLSLSIFSQNDTLDIKIKKTEIKIDTINRIINRNKHKAMDFFSLAKSNMESAKTIISDKHSKDKEKEYATILLEKANLYSSKADSVADILNIYNDSLKFFEAELNKLKELKNKLSDKSIDGTDKLWTIQIGASKNQNMFKSQDDIDVIKCKDGFYRYIIGKFNSEKEAKEEQKILINKGYKNSIIKNLKGISKNSTILNYVIKYDLHQNNFDITI